MVRIRKNASKLLGSDDYLLYPPPPPPPPPPPAESWGPHSLSSAAAAAGEEGGEAVLCRLNCSPWDVIGTDLEHLSCCFQEDGGGDEGRGIMGNGLKFEEYEEILATFEAITSYCSSSVAAAAEGIDVKSKDDKKVKKRRRRRKVKEEENAVDVHDSKINVVAKSVVVVCSKNDGKGWHCKRPANPRHTLCDHHLDLLRTYSSRTNGSSHRDKESYDDLGTDDHKPQAKMQRPSTKSAPAADESAGDGVSVKSHRPKAVAAASETAGDGFYYYYSGFGPWRGKKRSSGSAGTASSRAKEVVDDDDDDGDEKVEERKDDSGDASDGPVAGDDLDDDDDGDDDVEIKGRIVKKKGRKRVKARSLKSLM